MARINLKKIAFFTVIPILSLTAFIKVPCPVCAGNGTVEDASNMESVRVVSFQNRILDSVQDACTGYIVTKAVPVIILQNISDNEASGWLAVTLYNTGTNEDLTVQNLKVQVKGKASTTIDANIVFAYYSADIPAESLSLKVKPLIGAVEDITCKGTGRVTMNQYYLAKTFKDKLSTFVQETQEFEPDLSHGAPGSKEWLDFWELDGY